MASFSQYEVEEIQTGEDFGAISVDNVGPKKTNKGQQGRFSYQVCHKSFMHESGLYRHMLVHKSLRFSCDHCQLIFSRKDNLKRHRKEKFCKGVNGVNTEEGKAK
jgi:hypothetical protein